MRLYYDDSCSFCTRWAKKQEIPTRPLSKKPEYLKYESMVLEENDKVLLKSDAAIRIISLRGGIYKLILIGKVIPRSLRDLFYDWFGRIRHKLL